jgi:3-hydroxyisobutyrate dehydrogenase-like beta-hydroxyacid dehydrogenase
MSLDLVRKDQRLIVAFAEELGLPVPATTAAAEVVAAACAEGWGSRDMAALRRFLRESLPPRD